MSSWETEAVQEENLEAWGSGGAVGRTGAGNNNRKSKRNPNTLSVAIWLYKKDELRRAGGKESLQIQAPAPALNQKGKSGAEFCQQQT